MYLFVVLLRQQLFSPNFLNFWTPPHEFALIIGSFKLLGRVLSFNDYKNFILDQSSGFDYVRVYNGRQIFTFILLDRSNQLFFAVGRHYEGITGRCPLLVFKAD